MSVFMQDLKLECERIIAGTHCTWEVWLLPLSVFKADFFFLMQMMLQLALTAASVHEMEIQSIIQVPSKVTKFQRTTVKIRLRERERERERSQAVTLS